LTFEPAGCCRPRPRTGARRAGNVLAEAVCPDLRPDARQLCSSRDGMIGLQGFPVMRGLGLEPSPPD
jgi:hypothetical protein